MARLIPAQIEPDTVIYIEAVDNIQLSNHPSLGGASEATRDSLGMGEKGKLEDVAYKTIQSIQTLENTIQAYTKHILLAFQELSEANIDKVILEFGVNMGGEAGMPFVTKGTADCSLKIVVECSL